MPPRRLPLPPRLRLAIALLLASGPAWAQDRSAPLQIEADVLRSTTDQQTTAEGAVDLRQGPLRLRADTLSYDPRDDRVRASGGVRIDRPGAVYRGQALDLTLGGFRGSFLAPEFEFTDLGTRGRADRIDFDGRTRLQAQQARYTSCPRPDDGAEPDWELRARDASIDIDANEGVADGARLRFQGVTILALPRLSFPVTDARKSGWLPPTVGLDSESGLELSVPYYWNIAPNLDATLAPRVITRRGIGLDSELRYLERRFHGEARIDGLPHDRLAGRPRHLASWQHEHALGAATLTVDALHVSDDAWWKDFPRDRRTLTPRLLSSRTGLERPWHALGLDGSTYLRTQDWQVLQDADAPIVAPYARRPQLGLRGQGVRGPLELSFETELNRFERPSDDVASARPDGWRWHAAGTAAWPWRTGGSWLVPALSVHAARYRTDAPMADGRSEASRVIPTLSVDAGLALERETEAFLGRPLRQTLEPRLLYVRTPYRRQDRLPNFDAFGRDFNFSSIYATSSFAGHDRISDAHQLTAGATSRLLDAYTGAELLRLGIVQRFLFRDQRVAPAADGSADGAPLEQRFSDVLLLGATSLVPGWALDASLQYRPDTRRLSRAVVGATWSPGPFRTLSTRYRLARGISEQLELGWQWPLLERGGSGACRGSWYGVGRVNYSLRDSRITDSVLGVEYDAGCWIARVVSERLSTGRSEATTRLLLQLELVGLSRLGSNPLQVLKDNIPGYRLLRDERGTDPAAVPPLPEPRP